MTTRIIKMALTLKDEQACWYCLMLPSLHNSSRKLLICVVILRLDIDFEGSKFIFLGY